VCCDSLQSNEEVWKIPLSVIFSLLCNDARMCAYEGCRQKQQQQSCPKESMGTIYNTSLLSKLNKLMMEMYTPIFVSNRTINMDYIYTLPAVLILLLNQKVFAQGTVRKNQRMVPQCFQWPITSYFSGILRIQAKANQVFNPPKVI
jgi:hypothetical protein